jgi:RNA recognition motif-containing protein
MRRKARLPSPKVTVSRESIVMGNRLYVGNLPFTVAADTLRQAFAASGDVTDVHIVSDRESGQSRGFGFVTMGNAAEAAAAISAMNGAMLEGRALRVNEAEERPQRSGGGGGGGGGGGRGGGGDRGGRSNRW